ncbi:MAG: ribbon-helix-helix domain-containing protein [Micrococcales bacterium]|nr:ribbon-helix-helix domain-containing protein [Micrococcales bacterium]
MVRRTINGVPISDAQIDAWTAEAEAGYDVDMLRQRGRPSLGAGPGEVVSVRLDRPMLDALTKRAQAEGLTDRSAALRAAVRAWAHIA